MGNWSAQNENLVGSIAHNAYLKFNKLALKGLKSIKFSTFFAGNYAYEGDLEIREGAPNGTIIGKTHLKYFDENKGAMKYYQIPVKPTADETDLYLVFKNNKDKTQYITNANWILLNYKR